MKVYVDKLPKSCRECPCSIYDELDCCWCKAINGELTYITDNDFETKRLMSCPLQSLAGYTKQVRKEVCEEIRERAELFGVCKTGILKEEYRIDKDVLNEIEQGEIK